MSRNEIIYDSAAEVSLALAEKAISVRELVEASLQRARETAALNIYLELDEEYILGQADESDRRRQSGNSRGPLDGIPVSIKDNICIAGRPVSCASRILENYVSPFSAGVIERLQSAGAILFGRTNMDEFAMGSSTENSAFGPTANPWDVNRVPGGSSGGAAASVAAATVPLALGSDTGGSIRLPAALCGVIGVKPTYGRVSRYGLVAFASSLDQIGTLTRSVDDAALLLATICGYDQRDSTSHSSDRNPIEVKIPLLKSDEWKKLRVGVQIPAGEHEGFQPDIINATHRLVDELVSRGVKIVPLKSALWQYSIPVYYILATAEASSNLSRYDGVRYGRRIPNPQNLSDLYVKSRSEGFGPEVKRRILLGTYVLSAGYYDAYYKSAQRARLLIRREYADFFNRVDVLLRPTSPTTAFRLGEKLTNPLEMYQSDITTISANLSGVPAISIPAGLDQNGLPVGMQLTAGHFNENLLLRLAKSILLEFPDTALDYKSRTTVISPGDSKKKNSNKKINLSTADAEKSREKKKDLIKEGRKKSVEKKTQSFIYGLEKSPEHHKGPLKEKAMGRTESQTVKRTGRDDRMMSSNSEKSDGKTLIPKVREIKKMGVKKKKKTKKKVSKKKATRKKVSKKKAKKKTKKKVAKKKKKKKKVTRKKTTTR